MNSRQLARQWNIIRDNYYFCERFFESPYFTKTDEKEIRMCVTDYPLADLTKAERERMENALTKFLDSPLKDVLKEDH